jgi:hypothetical protein
MYLYTHILPETVTWKQVFAKLERFVRKILVFRIMGIASIEVLTTPSVNFARSILNSYVMVYHVSIKVRPESFTGFDSSSVILVYVSTLRSPIYYTRTRIEIVRHPIQAIILAFV